MSLATTLQKLGIKKTESEIYLHLVRRGSATGYQVSNELSLKRSTVYSALERLRSKGLARRVPQPGKQLYLPKDPRELVTETKTLADELDTILPKLLALSGTETKPNITYLEGEEAVSEAHKAFEHRARRDDTIVGFYAYEDHPSEELDDSVMQHLTYLKQKQVVWKWLSPDHVSNHQMGKRMEQQYNWEARFLPFDQYPSKISVDCLRNLTRIISRSKQQAILIENEDIANWVRYLFNMMWEQAKK